MHPLRILAAFLGYVTFAVAAAAGIAAVALVGLYLFVPVSANPDENEGHALAAFLIPRLLAVALVAGVLRHLFRTIASRFASEAAERQGR